MVEVQLRKGFVEPDNLNGAGILITGYDAAWRKRDLHHRTEATLADLKSGLQVKSAIRCSELADNLGPSGHMSIS